MAFEDLAPDIQRLARAADVTPSRITGYWTYQDELETVKRVAGPPKNGEKVLYAMHGGSYISLSAHSSKSLEVHNSVLFANHLSLY